MAYSLAEQADCLFCHEKMPLGSEKQSFKIYLNSIRGDGIRNAIYVENDGHRLASTNSMNYCPVCGRRL